MASSPRPAAERPGFRLTMRDVEIVDAVFRHRALTAPLVSALYFGTQLDDEPSSRARKRLRLLHYAGYLTRVEQASRLTEGRKPYVYFLDEVGAQLLAEVHGVPTEKLGWDRRSSRLSPMFLDHLLLENRIRVIFALAARRTGSQITTWIDDRSLRSKQMKDYVQLKGPHGGTRKTAIIPDGYFTLQANGFEYHHFIEADRSTVVVESGSWRKRDWARKVASYIEYLHSGLFRRRYDAHGFRVLTVTTSQQRLANLQRATEGAGGKNIFWFAEAGALTPDTVMTAPVWRVAGRDEQLSLVFGGE